MSQGTSSPIQKALVPNMAPLTSSPIQLDTNTLISAYANKIHEKQLGNKSRNSTILSDTEALILTYIISDPDKLQILTPSDLAIVLGNRLNIDNKDAWRILNNLAKRGIVVKIDRGVYIVDRDKAMFYLYAYCVYRAREVRRNSVVVGRVVNWFDVFLGLLRRVRGSVELARLGIDVRGFRRLRRCNVVKVHGFAGAGEGWARLLFFVVFLWRFGGFLFREVRAFLLRLGFSRNAVRNMLRAVREEVDEIVRHVKIIKPAVHGFRVGRKWVKAFHPDVTVFISGKEIGVNAYLDIPVAEKFFVKIYSDLVE